MAPVQSTEGCLCRLSTGSPDQRNLVQACEWQPARHHACAQLAVLQVFQHIGLLTKGYAQQASPTVQANRSQHASLTLAGHQSWPSTLAQTTLPGLKDGEAQCPSTASCSPSSISSSSWGQAQMFDQHIADGTVYARATAQTTMC